MRLIATSATLAGLISEAYAGPPQPFDAWSVNKGTVAAGCWAGMSCQAVGSGAGFLQRAVTDPTSGKSYLHTIVTGVKESGLPAYGLGFSDESFVALGQSAKPAPFGIADKQVLHSNIQTPSGSQVFDSVALLNTGWATSGGAPQISLTQNIAQSQAAEGNFGASFAFFKDGNGTNLDVVQTIADPGALPGSEFDNVTHLAIKGDAAGKVTGTRLALSQNIGLADKMSTLEYMFNGANSIQFATVGQMDPTERQVFLYRSSSGTLAAGQTLLWMYQWTPTGLHPTSGAPMPGQWYSCTKTTTQRNTYGCGTQNQNGTIAQPAMPFDPVPFNAPTRVHSVSADKANAYPALTSAQLNSVLMASPGPQTGGDVVTSAPPRPPLTSSPAGSGSPIALSAWMAQNGAISVNCPGGFTCKTIAQDNGFVELELTDTSSGKHYYQTVIAEKGATGTAQNLPFSSTAVVRQNPNDQDQNGASTYTVVAASADNIYSSSRIETGWARGAGPDMELIQNSVAAKMKYIADFNADGERSGYRLDIAPASKSFSEAMVTYFNHTAIGGDMVTAPGSLALPGRPTTDWDAGDEIKATFYSTHMVEYGTPPGGNTALMLNKNWDGTVSWIGIDNLSDPQPHTGLISPHPSTSSYWLADPFGNIAERYVFP